MHFERPSVGKGRNTIRNNAVTIPIRPGEWHGNTARIGDTVAWTNPNTGMRYEDLDVRFVYTAQGSALVLGWFGVMARRGGRHIQSQAIRLEHCVVTKRGGE